MFEPTSTIQCCLENRSEMAVLVRHATRRTAPCAGANRCFWGLKAVKRSAEPVISTGFCTHFADLGKRPVGQTAANRWFDRKSAVACRDARAPRVRRRGIGSWLDAAGKVD